MKNIHVSPETHRRLKVVAHLKGMTLSDLAEAILKDFLSQAASLDELISSLQVKTEQGDAGTR